MNAEYSRELMQITAIRSAEFLRETLRLTANSAEFIATCAALIPVKNTVHGQKYFWSVGCNIRRYMITARTYLCFIYDNVRSSVCITSTDRLINEYEFERMWS
jgi:hypothetical protein